MKSIKTQVGTMTPLTHNNSSQSDITALEFCSQETLPRFLSQPSNFQITSVESQIKKLKSSENDCEREGWKVIKSTFWHADPIEDYKISSEERGTCLIINNVTFENDMFPKRKGSDMDAFRFKDIFKQLGFSVVSKRNLTSDKMKAVFKQVSARCINKHDSLIVILLSHGTESGIFGVDCLEVPMHDILTYFDNRNCKQMMGKPKVFIIQACRGHLADYGVRDTQAFFSQPDSQSQPSQITQDISESSKISRWFEVDKNYHPTRTDMVLCFSCHTGFVSTRNEEDGSWLGTSLAQHLQNEAWRKHLIEIFNMVSRDVRKRKSSDGHKQVLEITTIGFDRNLYFNPGLYDDQE